MMSQTQFVEYKDHGFWAYDVSLGIFLKHLIDAAVKRMAGPNSAWLEEATSQWRIVACVSDYGLEISPHWNPIQVATFIELTNEACIQLAQRDLIPAGEIATWRILNDQRLFLRGATEIRTGPVLELGHAVSALVTGSLPAPPAGKNWLFGGPTGREVI